MRHRKKAKNFNISQEHRRALFNNLATALIKHGRIETTTGKAKVLKTYIEPMITRAKSGTLHDRREVAKFLTDTDAVKKLFTDLAELYKGRNGGYTRVLKLRNRAGDNAETALIELVDMEKVYKKEEPAAKKGEKKPKEAKPAKEPKAPKAPKAEKAVKEEKPAKKEKKADKK